MNKTVMIGLDGASWGVIDKLINQGFLPNICKLKEKGVSGDLKSTFPPLTAPAWTSMATGKNPGNTGVVDFFYKHANETSFDPVTSEMFSGETFWDFVSSVGFSTTILNYPLLFPPYKINGRIVSGLPATHRQKITYPENLQATLNKKTGGYRVEVPYHSEKYTNNQTLFVKELVELIEVRTQACSYLLKEDRWNLFVVIFSATDFLQHYFWKYWDEGQNTSEDQVNMYKTEFQKVWGLVDQKIGEIIDSTPRDTNFVLVSDHGFGIQKGIFYPNRWLKKEGFLITRRGSISNNIKKAGKKLLNKLESSFQVNLLRMLKKSSNQNIDRIDSIDLEKTRAFSLSYNDLTANIFLLGDEKKKSSTTDKLKNSIDRLNDNNILSEELILHEKRHLYWGDKVELLPDLVISGSNFKTAILSKTDGKRPIYEDKFRSPNKSGTHRRKGIFIASGPDIKNENKHLEISILDIAPTILKLFELSIPESMDGSSLGSILKE